MLNAVCCAAVRCRPPTHLCRASSAAAEQAQPAGDNGAAALPSSKSPALQFQVLAQQGRARTATMKLPHYTAETPMFMPVGTQGAHCCPVPLCALLSAALGACERPRQTEALATRSTPVPAVRCSPAWPAGTVKGLTPEQLQELDCHVILGNTYHLVGVC